MLRDIVANVMTLREEIMRTLVDPKRDIDAECGYPANPSIQMYRDLYDRGDIAGRLVDIYPEECWKVKPEVIEDDAGDYTAWEKEWKALVGAHTLHNLFLIADQISGVGRFGVILLGIDDGRRLEDPVEGVTGVRPYKPSTTRRKLLYVRAFDESVVTIDSYDNDITSPRYGQPTKYQINLSNDTSSQMGGGSAVSQATTTTLTVHWSRIIHLADNRKNSNVFGVPRMKAVFNRLYDLRKILGGSGEMFWKGGFPGLAFESQPQQIPMELTDDEKESLRDEFERYQNGLQRYLALSGMTAKSLLPQVADPTSHVEVHLKIICAAKGIPYRVFIGTEEAQLAGQQDKKAWNERLKRRQEDYITPYVISPFADRCIEMGILPAPAKAEGYMVRWPDMDSPSAQEKADVADKATSALQKYVTGNIDVMIPPLEYLTVFLGLDTEIATSILEKAQVNADGTLDRGEEEAAAQAAAAGRRPATEEE